MITTIILQIVPSEMSQVGATTKPCWPGGFVVSSEIFQIIDEDKWGVQPFCSAWGNNTVFGDKSGMLSYGEYQSGTGAQTDPMIFTGGSHLSCREVEYKNLENILEIFN